MDRRVSNADAEMAKVSGSRLLVFNELDLEEKVKLGDFKALSGGDPMPCAAKYGGG